MKRVELEAKGFRGFLSISEVTRQFLAKIPADPGVYIVLCNDSFEPLFLETSLGGRFKGKDPTVALPVLEARWVRGTEALYIGKADNLRARIHQLQRYSVGDPVGHWGGRYLWQLMGCTEFVVAWLIAAEPFTAERELLQEFKSLFGCWPFANIQGPRGASSS